MEMRQLRVLRALGETGSFSGAADQLDYTQPAISKIVAALERQVGATLVDRGTRPVSLTDAGAALAARGAAADEQLAAAALELEAIINVAAGRLRLGTFSSAGATVVVDALTAFRAQHPGVDVSIAEISMPSAIVRAVRDGELDIGITFDYPESSADVGEGLERRALMHEPFDVVLPARHPLASRSRIPFAKLARERWLLPDFGPDSPSFRMIDRRCAQAGFAPDIAFRVNDCNMTQALVAAGEGIALLPRLMLVAAHPGVAIRTLAADPPIRRVCALRLPTRYLTPATERFLALLDAAAEHWQRLPDIPGLAGRGQRASDLGARRSDPRSKPDDHEDFRSHSGRRPTTNSLE